jgi:ATP-dependent Clp protease ATP-binding subunit ClpC
MEQFSPNNSRVFTAAAFANLFSSTIAVILRWALAAILILLLTIFFIGDLHKLFYLILTISIIYLVFEIFYEEKTLKESPVALDKNQGNLADSFEFATAKFILKNASKTGLSSFLAALFSQNKLSFVLIRADITSNELAKKILADQTIKDTKINFRDLAALSASWAKKENRAAIDLLDIFLAIFSTNKPLQELFFEKEIKEEDILNIVFWVRSAFEKDQTSFWEKGVETLGPGISDMWTGGWTLETERFALDITKQMQKGKVAAFLVGRDKEIEEVEGILARAEKRNVILIGSAGVGKTSIVYGLAEKSIQGTLPPALKYKRFLEIDVTALLAGAAAGELEERIQNLMTEITHAGNVVLFIPELENLAGSSGTGVNITGHLLNALTSGRLQVIATTDRENYRRYIERQSSFSNMFEVIDIPETSVKESICILEEAAPKIESKNEIFITYNAIQKTVDLANKYLVDRVLPGKAIDLLDEASSSVSLKKKSLLEPSDVADVVSQKTKVPVATASGKEAKKLLDLEKILHERIVDQNEAIISVSNALRRARTIERQTKRPIGAFLFLGPTGVGKTETAKALSAQYFGSEDQIVRIDMSEYQDATSINRLIGAPPGTGKYEEGGEFTEKVRQKPFSLILLDEMEKANQKIQEAFLPVFDEGSLEDSLGRRIVFTNTIIIATSNAGAEFIREAIQQGKSVDALKRELLEKLQREGIFKPEFLNRFDDIVVYKPLSLNDLTQIVGLLTGDLTKRLEKQDIDIKVNTSALQLIAKSGYDPTYGARPLRRFIADNLEEKIAEKMLAGEIKRGSQVVISTTNNQLIITPQK